MFAAWIPMAVSAIASMAGSAMQSSQSSNDSEDARVFNMHEAEKSRDFSAAQAQAQMNFQERMTSEQRNWSEEMANTSYQRAVGDLGKAGLNPMLAYSQGGAPTPQTSVPSGAMGQSSQASAGALPQRFNVLQAGLNAAQQAQQIENLEATQDNIEADTAVKRAQESYTINSAENMKQQTVRIQVELPKLQQEAFLVANQANTEAARRAGVEAETALRVIQKELDSNRIDDVKASAAVKRIEELLLRLKEAKARNESNAESSWWKENVAPYLEDAERISRIGSNATGMVGDIIRGKYLESWTRGSTTGGRPYGVNPPRR